jgi:hypothetical protein
MMEIELRVPGFDVIPVVEACAACAGLQIHRGSLSQYPGSTHWHFTRLHLKGTLECTWWPAQNRLWLAVHANRKAAWQADAIKEFLEQVGAVD